MSLLESGGPMRPILAALLLATLSACGTDPGDSCETVTPIITLSGPAPVFDWTAACPLGALDVAPSDSADSFVWFVLGDPGKNSILPPATFGGDFGGSGVSLPPSDPLVSGRQYQLRLSRTTGPAGFGLSVVGQAEFTAP